MSTLPSLSIICVTYQDPSGLQATLASLLPLAGKDFLRKVVVVDSSPHLSGKILAEYQAIFPLLHLTPHPEGIYAAMNQGAREAPGEILWFLNGGDALLDTTALEKALAYFTANPAMGIISCAAKLVRNGKMRYRHRAPSDWMEGLSERQSFCHQAVLYRASAVTPLLPFDAAFRLAADFDLHLRAYLADVNYMALPETLVAYDTSGASAQSKLVLKEIATILALRLALRPSLKRRLRSGLKREELRIAFLNRLRALGLTHVLQPLWLAWKRAASKTRRD